MSYGTRPDNRYRDSPNSSLQMTGWNRISQNLNTFRQDVNQNIGNWFQSKFPGPAPGATPPGGMAGYVGLMGSPLGATGEFGGMMAGEANRLAMGDPGTGMSWEDKVAADAASRGRGQEMQRKGRGGYRPPDFSTVSEAQDIVGDFWQEQRDRYLAGMAAEEAAVRSQYSPVMDQLEDQIGDLRAAAAAVGMPFDEYLAARREIGGNIGEADKLDPSMMPFLTKIYDDAEAEVKDIYQALDMNLGKDATSQVVSRMKSFENVMEDVIRTDEGAVELLHQKSSEYAKAMAQAAFSGDVYAAMDAEVRINAQLDQKIEDTAEEIARQKRAMQAALDAAQARFDANFEYGEPDQESVIQETWNEYFEANNVNEAERAKAMGIFNKLLEDPEATLDQNSWGRATRRFFNQGILNSIGVSNELIEARMGQALDAKKPNPTALLQWMADHDMKGTFQNGQIYGLDKALKDSGFSDTERQNILRLGAKNADTFTGAAGSEAKHLRNMYDSRNHVMTNWESIVASYGPKVDDRDIARAPNGYTFPVAGGAKYSHDWGNPRDGGARRHEGIDLFAAKGTPVIAATNGTITAIDYGKKGGKFVGITDSQGFYHYYAHLNSYSKNIQIGSKVKAGTVIGAVGNTGNAATTPPHLHYGIYKGGRGGKAQDPWSWVQSTK